MRPGLWMASSIAAILAAAALAQLPAERASGGPPPAEDVKTVTSHVHRPERLAWDRERAKQALRAPQGFEVTVVADGLGKPRMMAQSPDGTIYVTRPDPGDVLALRLKEGKADVRTVVRGKPGLHGVAVRNGKELYLVTNHEVLVAPIEADGRLGAVRTIVHDLPDGGQHPNRTAAFGPDGLLYVSVGSSCNACEQPNPEHAAMLRMRADGTQRGIFARGLRNTIGFGWHPESGAMWGMDHGSDWRGDRIPPEEVNRLTEGGHYGWPWVYGDREIDPFMEPPDGRTMEELARESVGMTMGYTPHAAPIGMVFYTGDAFPDSYRGDAFIAMHGSWNRYPASGYEVVRIDFEGSEPKRIEPFVTGFLTPDGKGWLGRPAGLLVDRDGALLVTDDGNGALYRVTHRSAAAAGEEY